MIATTVPTPMYIGYAPRIRLPPQAQQSEGFIVTSSLLDPSSSEVKVERRPARTSFAYPAITGRNVQKEGRCRVGGPFLAGRRFAEGAPRLTSRHGGYFLGPGGVPWPFACEGGPPPFP